LSHDETLLLTDFRYLEQASEEAPLFTIVQVQRNMADLVVRTLNETGARRVGFESQHVTYGTHRRWKEGADQVELVPVKGLVEKLRVVKDEGELAIIREAVRVADAAMSHLLDIITPGMTERQVAWELESHMRTHGADKVSFDFIIASGPNGAMPHAISTDRKIGESDPVVVDIGAKVDGYCSDMTRTFCIADGDEKYLEIYGIVAEAKEMAESGLRAGAGGVEIDGLARDFIQSKGYGDQFGHGLGHGVGLAIHEGPTLSKQSQDTLEPGMVVTIEPGIYLPGWGGVRIEDMVVVREQSAEILTGSPKTSVLGRRRRLSALQR
jgi:Xaa-Pro aminopeptidase